MPDAPTPTARTLLLGVLAGALAGGCAPQAAPPAPTPTPAATPAPAAARPEAVVPSRFAWGSEPLAVVVRVDADVESSVPGSPTEREHLESAARVTLAVQPPGTSGTRTVTGRVDSLQLRASARVATEPPPAVPSVGVRGTVVARGPVRLDLATGVEGGCTTPAGAAALTALGLAREALPPVPPSVQVGARWRDTLVTASCAGPIPVAVQSVASYEVLPPDGALVRVRRQTASTLSGQGYGAGQPVHVTGNGTAEAMLLLDPVRGVLRSVAGEGRTSLTVSIGASSRTFAQRTRVRVEGR